MGFIRIARRACRARRAEAELRVVERGTRGLSFAEAEAEAAPGVYDARCDAKEEALVRALCVPAPDVGAFAVKVVWVVDLGWRSLGRGPSRRAFDTGSRQSGTLAGALLSPSSG